MVGCLHNKFFELIKISLGNCKGLSRVPDEDEWNKLFDLAYEHSLAAVLFDGVKKAFPQEQEKSDIFFEWFDIQNQVSAMNKQQNKRTKELCVLLENAGFRCCVLKGQGTALYYEYPELRQCGDIDIWVTKDGRSKTDDVRNEILQFVRLRGYHIGHVDIKHSDIDFFEDVPVEVHFLPSWMYNPFTNKKLQSFFRDKADKEFNNYDTESGFPHTTIDFDLVYSIVHIYRHIFSEGIGLRQLMDYYYILLHSSSRQRWDAYHVLKELKMSSFVGGIMWILKECFGMTSTYLLCPINEKHGNFLLTEIMSAGNFGLSDARTRRVYKDRRFLRGLVQVKRNLRFVSYYPSEVLWSPLWKIWHWCWRKEKGYL